MKKTITGILVVLFSCVGLQSGVLAEDSIGMGVYLNMFSDPGRQWCYEDDNGNKVLAEVLPVGEFKGIDAGRIQMVLTGADGSTQTLIEYYQMRETGLYQIGMEIYGGNNAMAFLSESPHIKLVSLPDIDDTPLTSSGNGTMYFGDTELPGATYSSSIIIGEVEELTMPCGTFKVLKMTCTQSYENGYASPPISFAATFDLYIEPHLGILALDDMDDDLGRLSLTGIANIPVPGDTDSDADVDGEDLTGDIADGEIEILAGYFGVSIPLIIN
nr:hypothetical protein [uncultured Desulfobacter sp.]